VIPVTFQGRKGLHPLHVPGRSSPIAGGRETLGLFFFPRSSAKPTLQAESMRWS